MSSIKHFSRFYALLKRMPGNSDELKESLVSQYTNGRTTSLREMSTYEYGAMCRGIESSEEMKAVLRKARSAVLHQMQLMGVNTADWDAVNAFCLDKRIAGFPFGLLNINELEQLYKKLLAIRSKDN